MPQSHRRSTNEGVALEPRLPSDRARIAQEYDAYLDSFVAGDYGRADLAAGEPRALVRQQLQAAARRRGLLLHFRTGPSPALIFRVDQAPPLPQGASAPAHTQAPAPPTPATTLPTPAPAPPTPDPGNSRERSVAPARPRGQRQTASERYSDMLPRWMRDGSSAGRRPGRHRGETKRRPR